jgi:hypothetical protein
MTGYGLIAAIVQSIASLAWPGVLVAIVLLFRKPIEDLLRRLRTVQADRNGVSLSLDEAEKETVLLSLAEKEQAQLSPAPPPSPDDLPDYDGEPASREDAEYDQFERIAAVSPRAAITGLLRDLEELLKELATACGLEPRPGSSFRSLTEMLRKRKIIDQHTSAILTFLRAAEIAAARGDYVSKEDAMRYLALGTDQLRRLRSMVVMHRAGPIPRFGQEDVTA